MKANTQETILTLNIIKHTYNGEPEFAVEVLKTGYNIIDRTIYDNELAIQIIELINNRSIYK